MSERDPLPENESSESARQRIDMVLAEVKNELLRAWTKHGLVFASPHEGISVIREELDPELWEHVCGNTGRTVAAGKEAIQVAAMAAKYVLNFDPRFAQ